MYITDFILIEGGIVLIWDWEVGKRWFYFNYVGVGRSGYQFLMRFTLHSGSVLVLVTQWRFCNSLISYTWTWWLTITLCDPTSTCSFPAVTRITSPPLGGLAAHFLCPWDRALTCAEAVVTGKRSTGLGSNRRHCPRQVHSYPIWATHRLSE